MKKLLSLLTLLSTLGLAGFGVVGPHDAHAAVVKHTKYVRHAHAVKYLSGPTCTSGQASSIYESGDCSSCAVASATIFDTTPLGEAYARLNSSSPLQPAMPDQLAFAAPLDIVTPEVVPVYVMPEHTILLTDSSYASYTPRTTTVDGFTVTTTDNPNYYSLFKHHYGQHDTKGTDQTRFSGISPRAGTLPENYGTMVKEQ